MVQTVRNAERATAIAALVFFVLGFGFRIWMGKTEISGFDLLCYGLAMLCIGQSGAYRSVRKQLQKEGTN